MLSAIEGIKVDAPQSASLVVPLTVAILVLLFIIQRMGTSWIGGIFGPIMLVWFMVIGLLGLAGIAREPTILAAFEFLCQRLVLCGVRDPWLLRLLELPSWR